jgi:WD40 repeat protein
MFTFTAHEGPVTSVAFAGPTGLLLSTGVDGHMRLWNPLTGEEYLARSCAYPASTPELSALLRVVADASGQFAAVGLRSRGVEFVDLGSGSDSGSFNVVSLLELTGSPDGRSLFVLGRREPHAAPSGLMVAPDTKVWQIRYPDGRVLASAQSPGWRDTGLLVAPDESEVVVGGARLAWPSGERAGLGLVVGGPVHGPRVVSHDKDKLFAPAGSRLGVWSYQIGVARHRLKGHIARITALVLTPDGRYLWTASADATMKCWDVETYRVEKTYRFPGGPLSCLAVSPDGNLGAAGCSHKGTITVWDLS